MPASIHSTAEPLPVMFLVGSLSTGGAERFVANVVTHLDRARFKPYLAMYRDTISYNIPDDVVINVLGKYKPWHNPGAVLRLARWIDAVKPAVLLSAWSVPNVFAAETLRWTRHRPAWIARIANNPAHREKGPYGAWARHSYRHADAFIVVCEGLAREFNRVYPFTLDRTRVLYNAVDTEALHRLAGSPTAEGTPHRPMTLVAVGRLHRQKRVDVMLRALAQALPHAPMHLHILGDGEQQDALHALAAELRIQEAITWHGFVENPHPIYAASDVFVLTSDYEGLSNALLESQALGLPAVATDCPFGTAEVIDHGKNGLLAKPGDITQIARHLVRLATDPSLRRRMSQHASARMRDRFSIEHMMDGLQQLLAKSAPQRPVLRPCENQ